MNVPSAGDIRSETAATATGHSWDEWYALLDEEGAQNMKHSQIARLVEDKYAQSGWWSQAITVAYERARELRARYERPDGYSSSVSRTIDAPASILFDAWYDPEAREQWLPDTPLTVRRANRPRSLRMIGEDDATTVNVTFVAKSETKTQVAVTHSKLPDANSVAVMKAIWAAALATLKRQVEAVALE